MEQPSISKKEALEDVRKGLMEGKRISFPSGVEVREDEVIIHMALDAPIEAGDRYYAVSPSQVVEERAKLHEMGLLPTQAH